MLTAFIVAFLLLAGTAAVTKNRYGKPLPSRHLALATAGVLALVFFGYTLGKDLAVHDNALVCHAPASATGSTDQSFEADVYAAGQFER